MGTGRCFGGLVALALVVIAATWGGCGTSNNQGISFRALGFFLDGKGTAGDAGRCASLSNDNQVPQATPSGFHGGFLGLENNMAQGINVDHVDLSYRINGARLAIPNDVFAFSTRLGPSSGQEPGNAPRQFVQITIASLNIFKFLNDNRSRLPDLPFELVAFATAVGTTDSGDVFETNRVSYEIDLVDEDCVPTTPTPVTTPQS